MASAAGSPSAPASAAARSVGAPGERPPQKSSLIKPRVAGRVSIGAGDIRQGALARFDKNFALFQEKQHGAMIFIAAASCWESWSSRSFFSSPTKMHGRAGAKSEDLKSEASIRDSEFRSVNATKAPFLEQMAMKVRENFVFGRLSTEQIR